MCDSSSNITYRTNENYYFSDKLAFCVGLQTDAMSDQLYCVYQMDLTWCPLCFHSPHQFIGSLLAVQRLKQV